jgi:hypothetical protein
MGTPVSRPPRARKSVTADMLKCGAAAITTDAAIAS